MKSERQADAAHAGSFVGDAAEADLIQEILTLQAAIKREGKAAQPDFGRARALRDALWASRLKLAALQGEPPPHTD